MNGCKASALPGPVSRRILPNRSNEAARQADFIARFRAVRFIAHSGFANWVPVPSITVLQQAGLLGSSVYQLLVI